MAALTTGDARIRIPCNALAPLMRSTSSAWLDMAGSHRLASTKPTALRCLRCGPEPPPQRRPDSHHRQPAAGPAAPRRTSRRQPSESARPVLSDPEASRVPGARPHWPPVQAAPPKRTVRPARSVLDQQRRERRHGTGGADDPDVCRPRTSEPGRQWIADGDQVRFLVRPSGGEGSQAEQPGQEPTAKGVSLHEKHGKV
jgi:hypothetical protein